VIAHGKGAVLTDLRGKKYLDANSSIWTNLHGHNHPTINRAIERQLGKIAHSSALGFANEPASVLAERLVQSVNASPATTPRLNKVFFSDDGSTSMEVALKLAYEYSRRGGRTKKPRFLGLEGAYHGDTIGAVSLGHIDLFHKAYSGLLFKSDKTPAPYCYRCKYNRAKPERADARTYTRCNWECLGKIEQQFAASKKQGNTYAGFVFEPLMQGAAGMIAQPAGWLRKAADVARSHGALLIADEIMTGFGRTGLGSNGSADLFACPKEGVQPDFMALAKGLTGGYLPMAATLTTQTVFNAFLGEYSAFKTFFHGHSYTGNQLGAAAGVASLQLLSRPESLRQRARLQRDMEKALKSLWSLAVVGDIRQAGLVAGIELVRDWRTREPFPLHALAGTRVCEAMARKGVLTRPIGNVLVLMPPYCTTSDQVSEMVEVMKTCIASALGNSQAS